MAVLFILYILIAFLIFFAAYTIAAGDDPALRDKDDVKYMFASSVVFGLMWPVELILAIILEVILLCIEFKQWYKRKRSQH